MRPLPLLNLLLLALQAVAIGSRRALRAAAPAPAPGLDRPSGSGGGDGCEASALLLPVAGPAVTAAAAELLWTCAGSEAQVACDDAATNASYVSAMSSFLSTAACHCHRMLHARPCP
mgnify:CR=1 FL=1